jgi:Cu/Ag efflux protein CusF
MLGVALGLLTGTVSVARAQSDEGMVQRTGPGSAERINTETVVVSGIDRANRTVTLSNADGERSTMSVPKEIKAYDKLKVGDHVDIDYYESIAVSIAPPGAKPSVSSQSMSGRTGPGAGMTGKQTTVTAKVVSVDPAANKVTFKGPKGNIETTTVSDPELQKKLPDLKPGQAVQFTYTQAMAASIRPSAK